MQVLLLSVVLGLGCTTALQALDIQASLSPGSAVSQRYILACKPESTQVLLRFRLINDGTRILQASWDEACKSCMTVQWDVPPPIQPGLTAALLVDIPFPLERPHREVVLVLRGTWEENLQRSWQCTFILQRQAALGVYPSVITPANKGSALSLANLAQSEIYLERMEYHGSPGIHSSTVPLHVQALAQTLAAGALYHLVLDELPRWSQVQSLAIHMRMLNGQPLAPYVVPVSMQQ